MATSLGMVIIIGMASNSLFKRLKLPGLLGMLLSGILLGPYVLACLDADFLQISDDLRELALIVILLRAGLGIKRDDLKQVQGVAIKLSCIPGLIEGFTIAFVSTKLLGLSFIEGGMLGFIIGAVSPAVVVPLMLYLKEQKIGTNKHIPTLILAGVSIDDVFAITIFTAFLGIYGGKRMHIGYHLITIMGSIILGILAGLTLGLILIKVYQHFNMRNTKKALLLLGAAIFLITLQNLIKGKIAMAGLLGVMALGFIIREQMPEMADQLASKFNKIWVFAEMLLFILVGAQVDILVAFQSGLMGLFIIIIGLIGRGVGVLVSTWGSDLTWKERLFCMVAYLPKATVQAAIGAVPLAMGVGSGHLILAIAVLSIIITAPLGSIGIQYLSQKLLVSEGETC